MANTAADAADAGITVTEQQQVAAVAAAPATTAAVPAEQRYTAELVQLRESFPDYDEGLILGMLEDQGGDMLEVHAALKVC